LIDCISVISVIQLGTIDYATGLSLQQRLVALRKEEKIGDVLLLLEHKPVITLGRNAKAANVVASPELLAQRGVELFETNRGGDVTFHGPGQLVGYPIFDLRGHANSQPVSSRAEENDPLADRSLESGDLALQARRYLGAVDFVRRLEEVLIRTCADFTISTRRVAGLTGVWTQPESAEFRSASTSEGTDPHANNTADPAIERNEVSSSEAKLAAIGIHISRFVTSHGFALNVNTDLSYFNLIVPCGITSKPVTSMQHELGKELDFNLVAESISRNFGVVFSSQILWVDTLDALLGRAVGVPMRLPQELRQLRSDDEQSWA
jgi:lipoyl(octanoyl) transferase